MGRHVATVYATSVLVGASSIQVLAANSNRISFYIQARSANQEIGYGATAVASGPMYLGSGARLYETDFKGAVYANSVTGAATSYLGVMELF